MLLDTLVRQVLDTGPLPFEDFMEACLYHPSGGFFATGPVRSTEAGDFLTSPEVSPWFGRAVARYVLDRQRSIAVADLTLVEVGAGSGSLLGPLLAELKPSPGVIGLVWAVEASPAARRALGSIEGIDHVVASLTEVPETFDGVVVANELLDNLPVALAVRTPSGWEERWVGVESDGSDPPRLALVPTPVRPDVAAWADAHGGVVREGGMVEVQLAASAWVRAAVGRIRRGAVVVFDYGGTAEELEPRRTQGTLRTYRNHHLGPDPLVAPGETDVTVDVNFSAMAAAAEAAGASVRILRQDDFLVELGLRHEISELRLRELELAAAGPASAMERLVVRSELTGAETLLHPRGLGDFRVLLAEKP